MKVNTELNNFYTTQRAQTSTATSTNPTSFSSALSASCRVGKAQRAHAVLQPDSPNSPRPPRHLPRTFGN